MADGVCVRPARPDELAAVMGVLDAAMLSVEADAVRAGIDRDDVLVAVAGERLLGACLLEPKAEGRRLDAIAVRPGRRGQGIGTALVSAADRGGGLVAEFDADRRGFYESLGFAVESIGDGRLRGVR